MGLIPDRFGLKDRTLLVLIGIAAWLGTCMLVHACAINRNANGRCHVVAETDSTVTKIEYKWIKPVELHETRRDIIYPVPLRNQPGAVTEWRQ